MRNRRPLWMPIVALMLLLALVTGCGSGRTVLVPEDSPIRVGPKVTGKAYQLIEGEWRITNDDVAYPEGWYVIPPRFVAPGELSELPGD